MIQDDYLRLQKNLPTTPPPPKGFVDLRYSVDLGSLALVDETGTEAPVSGSSGVTDYFQFNTALATEPTGVGALYWSDSGDCLEYNVTGGSISVGKETFDYYTNLSGVTMVDGDIVSIVGATGNRTAVDLTDATDATSSANVIGMVTQGAANNGIVRVTKAGSVHSLNTHGLTEGGTIYVDPAHPGKWTMTRPERPNHVVSIGVVQVAHAVNGIADVVPNHQCITAADITDPENIVTNARVISAIESDPSTVREAAQIATASDSGLNYVQALNPASVAGLIAGYRVDQTTRTGSSINVWRDISGHGRDATFVSTKDTVAGTAPDEYAVSGGLYTPSPTIPVDFTNHTMICIFGAGRISGRNAVEANSFALTDAAASGGGALVASGTLQFYNATRNVGCLRNRTGKNAITLRFGAGTCSARSNGITDKAAVNGAASVTAFAHIWGYNGAGGFGWHQERVALYFYNRVLSDAEVAGIEKWHGVDTPTGALHVIGDSYVDGSGGATTAQSAYARILESQTGLPLCAHGGSGMTFAALSSTKLATSITSSVNAGLNPVVVLDLGKNTLAAGTTDASMRTTYTTFCNAITATGADLVCVSMPPRTAGFSGGADATSYESNRLSFNAWLRTQEGTLFEKLADCGGDPRIGDVADLSGANYSGDGIHLSNAGHVIWAEIIKAEIDTL